MLQSEDQKSRVGANGDAPTLQAEIPMVEVQEAPPVDMDQPLLTPAAPVVHQDDVDDVDVTPQLMPVHSMEQLEHSDTAVQMLASVAATSIPQAQPEMATIVRQQQQESTRMVAIQRQENTQMVAIQRQENAQMVANTQMVAIQNDDDRSQPQIVEAQTFGHEVLANQIELVGQQKDNKDNMYQTVTIIPSAVAQGGEVSYVLIVSHPDGEQGEGVVGEENVDMSVYDFKEEKGAGNVAVDEEEDEEEGDEVYIFILYYIYSNLFIFISIYLYLFIFIYIYYIYLYLFIFVYIFFYIFLYLFIFIYIFLYLFIFIHIFPIFFKIFLHLLLYTQSNYAIMFWGGTINALILLIYSNILLIF